MTNKQTTCNKSNLIGVLSVLSLALIVFLISFPELYPVIQTGLDGSAAYAFNYFFANDIQTGVDVVFTYGPLGFLKAPLTIGNNLIYAIIFISITRLLFVFLLLHLGRLVDRKKWVIHFLVSLIISSLASLDLVILGIIMISLLICNLKQKEGIWFFISILYTVIGVLIKASIGFNALLIMFSYLLLTFPSRRSFRPVLTFVISTTVLFVLFWIVIYGNLQGIFKYFYATYELIKGNSSAVALHPYNNWYLIIICFIIFFYLPFSFRESKVFFLYGLIFLSLFAFWKYSFSREENFHIKSMLDLMILIFAIVLIISDKVRVVQIILMGVCLMLFYRNMELTDHYKIDDRLNFIGVNNFISSTLGYDKWVESSNNQSERNLMTNKFDSRLRQELGNSSVDIYPWDYSYIAANDLNWKPRPVIQSYASYTRWLDGLNAKHFKSVEAPDFIIWELDEKDRGDEFGGVDDRYLLNDEPQTTLEIFKNYDIIRKERNLLALERSEHHNLGESEIIDEYITEWNNWIAVPDVKDGILRARIHCKGNLLRLIRNFLYKDALFFVEYMKDDGEIFKYRIVPENAKDGIWVNPLIIKASDKYIEPIVKEIRFSNSVNAIIKDKIRIEWELTKVTADEAIHDSSMRNIKYVDANKMFGKTFIPNQSFKALNDFEKVYPRWSAYRDKISTLLSYSGERSIKLDSSDRFTPTFTISVEDLDFPPSATININASVFTYLTNGAEGNIVVTIQNGENMKYWNAVSLNEFSIPNTWNKVALDKNLPQDLIASDIIKIYVWSTGKNDLYVDDFEIKIEKTN